MLLLCRVASFDDTVVLSWVASVSRAVKRCRDSTAFTSRIEIALQRDADVNMHDTEAAQQKSSCAAASGRVYNLVQQ